MCRPCNALVYQFSCVESQLQLLHAHFFSIVPPLLCGGGSQDLSRDLEEHQTWPITANDSPVWRSTANCVRAHMLAVFRTFRCLLLCGALASFHIFPEPETSSSDLFAAGVFVCPLILYGNVILSLSQFSFTKCTYLQQSMRSFLQLTSALMNTSECGEEVGTELYHLRLQQCVYC